MAGFLITPSLYSAWNYWKKTEDAGIQYLLDTLNKVKKEPSPAMRAGIDFEDAVRRVCAGGTSPDPLVREAAEMVKGGIWQQRVREELDGDLLYGIADIIRRDTIFDLKRVNYYDTGKYEGSVQHLIYMYASGLPEFEYVVADDEGVYGEAYHWGAESLETLRERIAAMKDSLLSDGELSRAFKTSWIYRKEA
jgi:hypothetical protein